MKQVCHVCKKKLSEDSWGDYSELLCEKHEYFIFPHVAKPTARARVTTKSLILKGVSDVKDKSQKKALDSKSPRKKSQ